MSSPAAWHPDPTGRHEHRYWDGERWTEHVADGGVATTDPLEGSAAGTETGGDTTSTAGSSAHDGPGTTDGGNAAEDTPAMPPIEDSGPAEAGSGSAATTPPADSGPPVAPAAPANDGGYGAPTNGGGYGAPAGGFPAAAPVGQTPTGGSNGLAVAGMILGIASLVLSFVGALGRFAGILMLLVAIAAIVLGGMGKAKVKHVGKGNGMAITGLVTGIIGLIAVGLFFAGGEFWRAFSGEFADLYECLEETGDEEFCQEQFERSILERTE